ncbi:MAG: uracil-DNA glycosylase [Anaerolineae bacterium]|nr:uracil-DNA glycosylase [Anaerolineae bacterium]
MNNLWQTLSTDIVACRACPRLVAWREQVARDKRRAYQAWDYWGKPVPGFGDPAARLLVVGLAPGAHGSNRTGRMFTGDSSGDTLYTALHRAGFASQPISRHREDGLTLTDAYISAVGRCAPPGNRPTPQELAACRPFLQREFELMPQVEVIVALGQIAFEGCLRLLREHGYQAESEAKKIQPSSPRLPKFGHGLSYRFTNASPAERKYLVTSYHPSRQNTQTGRLNQKMLDDVFELARSLLEGTED